MRAGGCCWRDDPSRSAHADLKVGATECRVLGVAEENPMVKGEGEKNFGFADFQIRIECKTVARSIIRAPGTGCHASAALGMTVAGGRRPPDNAHRTRHHAPRDGVQESSRCVEDHRTSRAARDITHPGTGCQRGIEQMRFRSESASGTLAATLTRFAMIGIGKHGGLPHPGGVCSDRNRQTRRLAPPWRGLL